MTDERLTWVQIVRIPQEGVADFQRYEDVVLPLLPEYDGRLDARYRDAAGTVEVHVASFPSTDAMQAYVADERRQAVQHLLRASGATAELLSVSEVATG